MTPWVSFVVPGRPRGKGVPRFFRRGKFTQVTNDQRTIDEMTAWRHIAAARMSGRAPCREPMAVLVRSWFEIPGSWPRWKREEALARRILPTTKPDKMIDALKGVVFVDDAIICASSEQKFYGDRPRVEVSFWVMDAQSADITKPRGESWPTTQARDQSPSGCRAPPAPAATPA